MIMIWDSCGAHSLEKQDAVCERMAGLDLFSVTLDGGVTDYVQPLDHLYFRQLKNEAHKRTMGTSVTICSEEFWKIVDEMERDEALNSLKSFRHVGLSPFCAHLRKMNNWDHLCRRKSEVADCHLLWPKLLDLMEEVARLEEPSEGNEKC